MPRLSTGAFLLRRSVTAAATHLPAVIVIMIMMGHAPIGVMVVVVRIPIGSVVGSVVAISVRDDINGRGVDRISAPMAPAVMVPMAPTVTPAMLFPVAVMMPPAVVLAIVLVMVC
jgi:hypothetical protein